MDKQQTSYTQMFAVVRATCAAHPTAWNGFAPFSNAHSGFEANFPNLYAAIATEQKDSTGQTIDKAEKRDELEALGIRVMDAIVLHAHLTGNGNLKKDVYLSPSDTGKLSEDAFVGHISTIETLANIHAAAIEPLGIGDPELAQLQALRQSFILLRGTPTHIQNEAQRGGKELDRLIAEQNAFLDTMDLAAKVLRATEPVFVEEYFLAREIIDPGYGTRALTVTIVDASTHEPLSGATVQIEPGGLSKQSGEKGMCYIDSLPHGAHTLSASKPGYADAQATITIDGSGQKIDIAMESV